jgi:hypothetical protein
LEKLPFVETSYHLNMKHIIIFTLALIAATSLWAQKDTTFIRVEQEDESLEKPVFTDKYDYFYGSQNPSVSLFKVHFIRNVQPNFTALNLAFEKKLTPAFSLQGNYGLGIHAATDYRRVVTVLPIPGSEDTTVFYDINTFLMQRVGLDARWYFNMNKRIKKGLNANNFNGNYIALSGIYSHSVTTLSGAKDRDLRNTNAELRFGIQRRLTRYLFMDVSYGIGGVQTYNETDNGNFEADNLNIYSAPRITIGFALAGPDIKQEEQKAYCDVFRCFREEDELFKINMTNLFFSRFSSDGFSSGIDIAREQRIGSGYFSWEAAISASGGANYASNPTVRLNSENWDAGWDMSLKHYYSKRKRIAAGKEANNLSGYFWGFMAGYRHEYLDEEAQLNKSEVQVTRYNRDYLRGGIFWGLQKRLFQNGFIELQLRLVHKVGTQADFINGKKVSADYDESEFLPLMRIGFAF